MVMTETIDHARCIGRPADHRQRIRGWWAYDPSIRAETVVKLLWPAV